jgi:hypothetical protein
MKRIISVVITLLLLEITAEAQQWTVMLYFMSHNSLYSNALKDLDELQKIQNRPGVTFIVQIDSDQGAKRYKVDSKGMHLLAYLGDVNSGSPEALMNFGIWAADRYPAKYNALVLWDHGDGWSKGGKYIGYDELYFDYLYVSQGELRSAVSGIVTKLGKPFDLIAMDACGMQMAEVLLEFKNLGRFAVGSQAMFPLSGLPYDLAFKDIEILSPEMLSIQVVNSCRTEYSSDPGVTYSAVNLDKLTAWAAECSTFSVQAAQLGSAGTIDAQSLADSAQRYSPFDSYDLFDVLNFFSDRTGGVLSEQAIVLKNKLLKCIIAEFHNPGAYDRSKGLSVWLSATDFGFNSRINEYWHLNWTKLSSWDLFLCSLIGLTDSSAPIVQNLILNKTGTDGYRLSWNGGYDQNRIIFYQIRRISGLSSSFFDNAELAGSNQLVLNGFVRTGSNSGYISEYAYKSTNGSITTSVPVEVDTNGGIGWMMKAQKGYCYLQISSDTLAGWDTLARYPGYLDTCWNYFFMEIPTGRHWIKWTWSTESLGWAFIDDIKSPAYSKDSLFISQTTDTFFTLPRQSLSVSEYQVRAVDGRGNKSYWSAPVTLNTGKTAKWQSWPNPSSGEVNWVVTDKSASQPKITVFNLLGQMVATPNMVDKQYLSAEDGYNYYFKWWVQDNCLPGIASGVYTYKIISSGAPTFGRVILVK